MKGKIAEVFASIQGEGLYLGEKQVFVRFYGCNLNCGYCDTKLDSFKEYESQKLFEEIKRYGERSISFTGGEPLLQKDFLKELLKLTFAEGFINYLETNGTLFEALAETIDYLHIVAMDLKLPSSTGAGPFWGEHRRFLEIASSKEVFLKTVICQATEEEDLRQGLRLIKEINQDAILVLQPSSFENDGRLTDKLKRFKDIGRMENVSSRIIPQMHKIAGIR